MTKPTKGCVEKNYFFGLDQKYGRGRKQTTIGWFFPGNAPYFHDRVQGSVGSSRETSRCRGYKPNIARPHWQIGRCNPQWCCPPLAGLPREGCWTPNGGTPQKQ